jgi:thiol-disulfide isomerase/thioredoxin
MNRAMKTWSFSPKQIEMRYLLLLGILLPILLNAQHLNLKKTSLIEWGSGHPVSVADLAPDKPTVILTLATECPICQKYAGTLSDLAAEYPQVVFIGVFTKWEDTTLIPPFIRDYKLTFPIATDPAHRLIKSLKTDVTPEAFLVSPEGELLYRGSINDWFAGLGKYRSVITQEYLRQALDEYLAGKAISLPQTKAIGCVFTR